MIMHKSHKTIGFEIFKEDLIVNNKAFEDLELKLD